MTTAPPLAPKRPIAVTIIGILLVVTSVAYLVEAAIGLSLGDLIRGAVSGVLDTQGALTPEAQSALQVVLDLLRGFVTLFFVVNFFRMRRWAWVGIMTWLVLSQLNQLFRVISGDSVYLLVLLDVVTVFALIQTDVRKAFGIIRDEHDPLAESLNSVDGQ